MDELRGSNHQVFAAEFREEICKVEVEEDVCGKKYPARQYRVSGCNKNNKLKYKFSKTMCSMLNLSW